MSPSTLRRFRAERLLRHEFEGLRARVLSAARGRLLASGVRLDQSDLEACYAQAWQGLYAVVLEGQEIANPAGWLALVTYRRAVDEHRSRKLQGGETGAPEDAAHRPRAAGAERDIAAELDDRIRLRQLFEGMRGRLSARELQAATLCYLQGLTRAEAAVRMGVSEARMRKLMEGQGSGRPGVAGKVGALVETIRGGGWCSEQASLMRGYAYGILDPQGDRYRLARLHRDECPACRAYVTSLRGLAATLPPAFPLWSLAGAIRPGGGWRLAGGSIRAKLAAGGVLALGVGGVALPAGRARGGRAAHVRGSASAVLPSGVLGRDRRPPGLHAGARSPTRVPVRARGAPSRPPATSVPVSRDFRPEQAGGSGARRPPSAGGLAWRPAAGVEREFGAG